MSKEDEDRAVDAIVKVMSASLTSYGKPFDARDMIQLLETKKAKSNPHFARTVKEMFINLHDPKLDVELMQDETIDMIVNKIIKLQVMK